MEKEPVRIFQQNDEVQPVMQHAVEHAQAPQARLGEVLAMHLRLVLDAEQAAQVDNNHAGTGWFLPSAA